MWCHCVCDFLVRWSSLLLLSPRVCSQHGSFSNTGRAACLYLQVRRSVMLLSLCTEAGWMFSSRWDHRGVGSTLIWYADGKKNTVKKFIDIISTQDVTHMAWLWNVPNFVFRSFARWTITCCWMAASKSACFVLLIKVQFLLGGPQSELQINKSKHVKVFDVFIV